MRKTSFILFIIICILVTPFAAISKERAANIQCQIISSKSAMTRAKNKTGGKVVSIKLDKKGKKPVYRVRLLVGEKRIKNISIKACK